MHIRRALIADAAAIARVHIAAWQSAYRGLFPDEFLDGLSFEQREAQWVRNLTGSESSTAVAEDAREVVGFVSYGASRDNDCKPHHVAEIMAIYVAPDVWGQGVGTTLFEFALADLATQAFEVITIWVLEANSRAIQFYERLGFVHDGRSGENTHGPPLKVVRFRRDMLRDAIASN